MEGWDLGRRMKEAHVALGLTVRQAAHRAEIAIGYRSNLETGKKRNPGLEVIRKIAAVLGLPPNELL